VLFPTGADYLLISLITPVSEGNMHHFIKKDGYRTVLSCLVNTDNHKSSVKAAQAELPASD
jgi:hypothetical protein